MVAQKNMNALVVDDHKMICDSIAALLEKSEVAKAYRAYSGEEALAMIKSVSIQLALIDARMPGMSGIDLMRSLQKEHPSIKMVAMTSFDEAATLKELLSMKPNGILLKRSTDEHEIKQCIKQVLAGHTYYSPDALDRIRETDTESFSKTLLSKREKEIVQLMRAGNSTKEIAVGLKLSATTVEDYRKELLRKAGVKNASELIDYMHRNGLI